MAFTLSQRRTFVADHFHDLPGFEEARHGHNWELEAAIRLRSPDEGTRLASALEAWVRQVDYRVLNELQPLQGRNPTAEALAEWAFRHLEAAGLDPAQVRVREKANYWALCRNGARP